MKFASCASFLERSIYYIHIPCAINMVRPSRSDEFVSVKVYYRDQSGVMRAIDDVFLLIDDNGPGVIVYTNLKGKDSITVDLR